MAPMSELGLGGLGMSVDLTFDIEEWEGDDVLWRRRWAGDVRTGKVRFRMSSWEVGG